jgi:hypothetical protein
MIDAAFILSVSQAKTVHTAGFFLLRSHAITVDRHVRFSTLDPGSKS